MFGSGQWSDALLGVNIRKLLFLVILSLSVIANIGTSAPSVRTLLCIAGATVLTLVWVVLLPSIYFAHLDYSMRDSIPLIASLCIIPFRSLMTARIWSRGRLIIGCGILVTSLLQILYYLSGAIVPGSELLLVELHRTLLDPLNLDPENAVFASTVDGITRVNWPGTGMLLIGLYIFCTVQKLELRRRLQILAIFIITFALYAAQTRALQISSIILVIVHQLTKRRAPIRILPIHVYSTLIFCLALTLPIVLSLDPQLLESIGISRGGSDDERYDQIMPLLKSWLEHPFFGHGFGASTSIVRSSDSPFAYEMFVLALLMKLGLVGVALMIFILSNLVLFATHTHRRIDANQGAWVLGLTIALAFSTNTNPYLTSLLGTLTVVFVLLELQFRLQRPS